jgi:DNA repair exonuclease SbcCD ATPase subunit
MLNDQAHAGTGAVAAPPDGSPEEVGYQGAGDGRPGAEGDQRVDFEQINLLIQSFGDQYVAHLRTLTATLEQFHARRLAERDAQIALLTEQLAARDAQLVELRRQLDASEGERAELTARLQAMARSEMRYAQSLHVLDDQVRRLLDAHEAGHRMVGNTEEQVS